MGAKAPNPAPNRTKDGAVMEGYRKPPASPSPPPPLGICPHCGCMPGGSITFTDAQGRHITIDGCRKCRTGPKANR